MITIAQAQADELMAMLNEVSETAQKRHHFQNHLSLFNIIGQMQGLLCEPSHTGNLIAVRKFIEAAQEALK